MVRRNKKRQLEKTHQNAETYNFSERMRERGHERTKWNVTPKLTRSNVYDVTKTQALAKTLVQTWLPNLPLVNIVCYSIWLFFFFFLLLIICYHITPCPAWTKYISNLAFKQKQHLQWFCSEWRLSMYLSWFQTHYVIFIVTLFRRYNVMMLSRCDVLFCKGSMKGFA